MNILKTLFFIYIFSLKFIVDKALESKSSLVFFFGKSSHVTSVPIEKRETLNSDWYTTIWLAEVFVNFEKPTTKEQSSFT